MNHKRQDMPEDSPAQIERFKEAARALGCDEDEAAFDGKLKEIARQIPKDDSKAGRKDLACS